MLEEIKKIVGEHIEAAKKHDVQYLPWDVTNAFLLVKLSERLEELHKTLDHLISGGLPHAQEEKNTQDQKTSVETLPEDDQRVDAEATITEDLGDPLDWSDADLDKLAAIGDDDLTNAAKFWNDNAPDGFAGLLNAEKEEQK